VVRDGRTYAGFKFLNKSKINGFSMTSKGIPAITHAFNKEQSIQLLISGGSGSSELKWFKILVYLYRGFGA
jgi:hypothetical protein